MIEAVFVRRRNSAFKVNAYRIGGGCTHAHYSNVFLNKAKQPFLPFIAQRYSSSAPEPVFAIPFTLPQPMQPVLH